MAVISTTDEMYIDTGASWQRKIITAGARSAEIQMLNNAGATCNYFVQGIRLTGWKAVAAMQGFATPVFLVPVDDGAGATSARNIGSFGSSLTLSSGSEQSVTPGDANNNGTSGTFLSTNATHDYAAPSLGAGAGAWGVWCWVYISALSGSGLVFYQETDVATGTKIIGVYIDATRRLAVFSSAPFGNFAWSDGAGTQVPLNTWALIGVQYDGATHARGYIITNSLSYQSASIATSGTYGSWSGTTRILVGDRDKLSTDYTTLFWTFAGNISNTAANAIADLVLISSTVIQIDSGTLALNGVFNGRYGEGTGKPLPSTLVYGISNNAGDCRGKASIVLRD